MFTSTGFTTTLLTLAIALKEVSSSGTLFIKFIQYTNPGGKGDNGHCCDGRGRACPSQCDHYFRVCADTDSGSTSMDACAYGEIETNSVRNENNIDFRRISGIGSETPNPLAFPFERWTGSTSIKVKVYDSDNLNGDDFVDTLRGVVATSPSAFYSPVTLRARTSLELQVYIRCNRNWYGTGCDVHCVSRDDSTGHFRCQRQTGVKQCLSGWGGEVCDVNINECASSPCQNGGTCVDNLNGFTCYCEPGFTGRNCETNIDECISSPCQRGGSCRDLANSYSCQCLAGWTGVHCEDDVDECASSPCENGGLCRDMEGSYECTCEAGYSGRHCEVDIDECVSDPCQNGGRCQDSVDGFVCVCMPGFTGGLCEVEIDHCESGPCQNDGSCTNSRIGFTCQCHEGWEGLTCSENINECETGPCKNGGVCRDLEGSYECTCEAGYSGRHCEVDIDECVSDPCENGGRCQDNVDGFVCICPKNTGGRLCEDQLQNKTPAAQDPLKPTQHTKMGESSKYLSETEARTYVFDRLLYMKEEVLVRRIVDSKVKVLSQQNPRMELRILPFFGTCNDPKSHRHSAMRLSIVIKPNDNMTTSVLNAGLEVVMESVTARITSVRDVTNNADNTCTVAVVISEPVPKTNAFFRYWVLITAIILTVVVVAAIVVFTLCRLRRKNTKQRKDRERSGPAFEQGFVGCEPSSQIGNTGMLIDSLSYYDKIKIEEDMLRRDSIDSFKIPLNQMADSHL